MGHKALFCGDKTLSSLHLHGNRSISRGGGGGAL